jgi:glucose/arabinose dehydrogenase
MVICLESYEVGENSIRIVAYLSHPDLENTIEWSTPENGHMIAKGIGIYAPGLRNLYGLVFHSNGKLYATDQTIRMVE